ncbi:MAG: ribonuclease III [Hyphomicrobiales bacterium]|nr:MAG: ribonuclease III [Hyphomicrobiales bacterium]
MDDDSKVLKHPVRGVLLAEIGHQFAEPELLERALTHSSALEGIRNGRKDNERLEFLGDRVLGLVVADMLIDAYPQAPEGELARRFNALVRRETCAEVAREISLGNHLILGSSEDRGGGRQKEAILADGCEALIAAIYRDGGLNAASRFIRARWEGRLDKMASVPRDPKTLLQEWVQARALPHPVYEVVERSGPDHAPEFTVRVNIAKLASETGKGMSKRRAEQAAARAVLDREGVTEA